jgi:DNA-binding XRE family transcriptional regulator
MREATGYIVPGILFGAILFVVLLGLVIYLLVLIIRALRKYVKSGPVRAEKQEYKKSLGEALKAHRTACHMTQEFVAETLGVTRQAVSKWENGTADPSTSNLLALAKLYGISAQELLSQVRQEKTD